MAKVLVQGLAISGKPASDSDKDRRKKELKLMEEDSFFWQFKKLKEKWRIEKRDIEEKRRMQEEKRRIEERDI